MIIRQYWVWLGLTVVAGCSGNGNTSGGTTGTSGGGAEAGAGGNVGAAGSGGSAGTGGSTSSSTTASSSGSGGSGGSGGKAPIKVVVIGSSTAAAKNLDQPMYGGDPSYKGWVVLYREALMAARPGSEVISYALPGASTYNALPTGTPNTPNRPAVDPQRNITIALAQSPDAVIVSYPSGGSLESGGYTVQELVQNLHTIVDTAAAVNVPVWVTTVQPQATPTTTMQTIALSLSFKAVVMTDFGAKAIDFWTPLANADNTANSAYHLINDQHPNAAGHQLLFQVVDAAKIPNVVAP
jgi:hypothetical protein